MMMPPGHPLEELLTAMPPVGKPKAEADRPHPFPFFRPRLRKAPPKTSAAMMNLLNLMLRGTGGTSQLKSRMTAGSKSVISGVTLESCSWQLDLARSCNTRLVRMAALSSRMDGTTSGPRTGTAARYRTALNLVGFDTDSEAFDFRDCDDQPRTFHDTTFKSVISIVQAGGLRAGPNGHNFNGRHYKGVFQSAHLGEAFQRADPKQGMGEVGVVHPCAMLCVLELRVSHLHLRRFHKTRKDLFVTPGAEGQVLRIIRIVRVHFNWRYVENFWALDTIQAVHTMQSAPVVCLFLTVCGSKNGTKQRKVTCTARSVPRT